MTNGTAPALPELLYLPHGDPAELAATLSETRAADVAEALQRLSGETPTAAARVLAALPFDLAVQALDEPELERKSRLVCDLAKLEPTVATALIEAMSADVTGLVIYFSVAAVIMRGTLL